MRVRVRVRVHTVKFHTPLYTAYRTTPHHTTPHHITHTGQPSLGTTRYMAPELLPIKADDRPVLTPKVDIYRWGGASAAALFHVSTHHSCTIWEVLQPFLRRVPAGADIPCDIRCGGEHVTHVVGCRTLLNNSAIRSSICSAHILATSVCLLACLLRLYAYHWMHVAHPFPAAWAC